MYDFVWNHDFPIKNGDFPIKNGDFPIKNGDFPIKMVIFPFIKMVIFPLKWWFSYVQVLWSHPDHLAQQLSGFSSSSLGNSCPL